MNRQHIFVRHYHMEDGPTPMGGYTPRSSEKKTAPTDEIILKMRKLTDDERLLIIQSFCANCGSLNPLCKCWNED